MICLDGVPVVAKRLQEAPRSAGQRVPCHGATTADPSARDEFQSGVDMDPGAVVQRPIDTHYCLWARAGSPE